MKPSEIAMALPHVVPDDAAATVSFAALFGREASPMVRLAISLVDSPDRAEEIVQDAFESLYKRWSGLRDPGAAVAYLDRAVVYGARSWVRRRITARGYVLPDSGTSPSAESEGVDLRRNADLAEAIRGLPQRQREVVVLRYYLDLSEEQIAAWLGVSTGSVKRHAFRATAALQKRMEAWA